MNLGSNVNSILNGEHYVRDRPDRRAMLEGMGFSFVPKRDRRWQQIKVALETYKAIYGDLYIMQSFEVPSDDAAWPEETWGLKLGLITSTLRLHESYCSHEKHGSDGTARWPKTSPSSGARRAGGAMLRSPIGSPSTGSNCPPERALPPRVSIIIAASPFPKPLAIDGRGDRGA